MITLDLLKKEVFPNNTEGVALFKKLAFNNDGKLSEIIYLDNKPQCDVTYHFRELVPRYKSSFSDYNTTEIKMLSQGFCWIAITAIKEFKKLKKRGHCGSCYFGARIFPAIAIISLLEGKEKKEYGKKIMKSIRKIKSKDFSVWCCDEYMDGPYGLIAQIERELGMPNKSEIRDFFKKLSENKI